jgi:LmbE family N-acetylglucosaminyl deacetylase
MTSYLFIGAHPDDVEIGAGATISKYTSMGIDCHTVVFSNCYESLPTNLKDGNIDKVFLESISAHKILGVGEENISKYDFPVRNFQNYRQEILDILYSINLLNKFTKVFIPNSNDIHQDHHTVFKESQRAFRNISLYGYELPGNSFKSNYNFYSVVNKSQVETKIRCLNEFKSQSSRYYMNEDKIINILKFHGQVVRADFAEVFELFRLID